MKPMVAILMWPPQIYSDVADIVKEILTVSDYQWERINIVWIEIYQQWPLFPLKFVRE